MYRDSTVAIVVPAYNEEGYVGGVIDDLPAYADRAYVVDDGSTDGTWDEIRRHARRRNETHRGVFEQLVVPIQHEKNRGVGGAIKTGYQRARQDEIAITAVLGGDGQMDPDDLPRYLDPIVDGVADYVKGNRFMRPADWDDMPRFRLLGNVMLSYLTKIASGYWESMDSQNGYTAISLAALERVDVENMYEYYGYCNDLLVRLNEADVTIADVARESEFAYREGWKSHIDYSEYIPRVSVMLLIGFLRRLRRKYLLSGYSPLVALYAIGSTVLAVGVAGTVASVLRSHGDNAGGWVLSATLGSLVLLAATEYDRLENQHLQARIPPEGPPNRRTGGDPSGDSAPAPREVLAGVVNRSGPGVGDSVEVGEDDDSVRNDDAIGNGETATGENVDRDETDSDARDDDGTPVVER